MSVRDLTSYLSGLDWSGDPGDQTRSMRANPGLVVAICSVLVVDHHLVDDALHEIRRASGMTSGAFHHARMSPVVREEFFGRIAGLPIRLTCRYVDKNSWSASYLKLTSGPERIRQSIVELVEHLPDEIVAGQTLLVDQHRDEKGFIRNLRGDLRGALRAHGRRSFQKLAARPDHRSDAALVQLADMFAGEVRRKAGTIEWGRQGQLTIVRDA